MSHAKVEEKEAKLEEYIYKWAKRNGLAVYPEQIRVRVTILKRPWTRKLTDNDWKALLSEIWEWSNEHKAFLQMVKDSNNNGDWTQIARDTPASTPVQKVMFEIQGRLFRSQGLYKLIYSKGDVYVSKRLIV